MNILKRRLPEQNAILGVFSFLLFAVFSWSLRGFLYIVPSFLLNYDAGEIAAIFFFHMAFALLESTLVMGGMLAMAMVLPLKWLKTGFSYKGFLTVLVTGVTMILLQDWLTFKAPRELDLLIGFAAVLALLVGLILLVSRFQRLQVWTEAILDRFAIFSYVYIPLGIIGLLVTIFRNILG